MERITLDKIINKILFLYILSLYLFTYREGLNNLSNMFAAVFILGVWIRFLVQRKKLVINKFLLTYLLFLGICLISIFYSIDKGLAVTKTKTLIMIFILMLSLINYVDSEIKIRKLIGYFIFSGFIASVYILVNVDFSQILRFGGDLGNVNAIGMIISISLILGLDRMITNKKYLYIVLLLPMFIVILLTGSRKSLIFVIMSFLIIMYLKNRDNLGNKFKFIIISIIALLGVYYIIFNIPIFYQIIGKRIENLFLFITKQGTKEGSINTRDIMIKFGLEKFKQKPIFGYGLDNYRVLFGRNFSNAMYAHNNYVELLVGVGIIGTITYYYLNIIVMKDLLNNKKQVHVNTIRYPFLAIIICYLLLGTSLVYYDSKHYSVLLALASIVSRIESLNNQ